MNYNYTNDFNNKINNPYTSYSNINAPGYTHTIPLTRLEQQPNHSMQSTHHTQTAPIPLIPHIPQVMTNQIDEVEASSIRRSLKSNAQYVGCPYCKQQSMTRVEKNCSFKNVLCGVLLHPMIWLVYQAVRGKDINCYDADHYCSKCGNKLAEYKAC
jgi:hypothetical protein